MRDREPGVEKLGFWQVYLIDDIGDKSASSSWHETGQFRTSSSLVKVFRS